jgi:hypothetical protein
MKKIERKEKQLLMLEEVQANRFQPMLRNKKDNREVNLELGLKMSLLNLTKLETKIEKDMLTYPLTEEPITLHMAC